MAPQSALCIKRVCYFESLTFLFTALKEKHWAWEYLLSDCRTTKIHAIYQKVLSTSSFLSGGVFLRDVSCYFSVLEERQPREKLECWLNQPFYTISDKCLYCITALNECLFNGLITDWLFVSFLVTFKLYDKDNNGLLDSSVSYSNCSVCFQ